MATKLSTSLRNSVSAEKKSVNEKKFAVDEQTKGEIQAAKLENAQPMPVEATATVDQQASIRLVQKKPRAKAASKPLRSEAVKPDLNNKVEHPLEVTEKLSTAKASITNPLTHGSFARESGLSGIQEGMERLSAVSGEFSNTYIASMQALNATINDYLQKLSNVKDFTGIYNANLELLSKLRTSQQDLWQKNAHFFKNIKQCVVPKLK